MDLFPFFVMNRVVRSLHHLNCTSPTLYTLYTFLYFHALLNRADPVLLSDDAKDRDAFRSEDGETRSVVEELLGVGVERVVGEVMRLSIDG